MKAGWELKRLGDLCAFDKTQGIHINLPYVGLEHIESGTGQYLGNLEPTDVKSSTFKFNDSHVLYGRLRPYLNKVLLPDFEGHCSTEIFPIQIKPGLLREYLGHWLMSESVVESINATCTGARMPRADMSEVLEFNIPVPSEQQQRRIVTLLDEAFADIATAKANAEKNLQNARELFDAQRQSVFSDHESEWIKKPLGDLCDFLNGFAFKSVDAVNESHTQLVRMGNLYGGELDLERNAVFYPDDFSIEYKRFLLYEGDIIMSLTGTTGKEDFGFAVQVPASDKALLMNQRIVKFDSIKEDKVCREFLLHYLCSRVFLDLLYPTANGTRQANLSSVVMKTLPVPIPLISDQKTIARSLDSLQLETQRLESFYRQKLNALDDLKKSLLHQAFSGQL